MSFSTITIPTTNSVVLVDTRQGANKIVFLPEASSFSGRYLLLKDFYGTSSSSSFTISTTATNTIDYYNSTILVSTSFQSLSLMSDGISNWATLANQVGPLPLSFQPTNIATPEIWFDASYLPNLKYDTANCNVIGWSNRGSIAVSADSNGSYTPPKVFQDTQNGLNVLTYSASNTLIIPSMALASSDKSCFAVFKQDSNILAPTPAITFLQAQNGYNFLDFSFLDVHDAGSGSNIICTINGGYYFPAYEFTGDYLNAYTMVSLVALQSNDSTRQGVWVNGTQLGSNFGGPSDNNSGSLQYSVGGGTNDRCPPYKYAECLVFNSGFSAANRQQMEGYMAWKWGLRVLLPSDHPYKNAPP
jgi:hypothetical protein